MEGIELGPRQVDPAAVECDARAQISEWYSSLSSCFVDSAWSFDQSVEGWDSLADCWASFTDSRAAKPRAAAPAVNADLTGMMLIRVDRGKAVEGWVIEESERLLNEFGVVPMLPRVDAPMR